MGRSRWNKASVIALGTALTLAWLTRVGHAKPWKQWAPDPLASDSAYAALSAIPSDSLSASQLSWLAVQRDWRAQRAAEAAGSSPTSITSTTGPVHSVRPNDKRFAALAAQPYAALADTDRAWLVAENAAQQVGRDSHSSGYGFLVLVAVVAVIAAIGAIAATSAVVHPAF
jgi:hypothetical protein